DAGAAPGLRAQVVGRPDDALAVIEVVVDLAPVVGVVAERYRVDAGAEHLVGDVRGDAQTAGRVLAVDDDERRLVALTQLRQQREQRAPPGTADDVADEEDRRGRSWHARQSPKVGSARWAPRPKPPLPRCCGQLISRSATASARRCAASTSASP